MTDRTNKVRQELQVLYQEWGGDEGITLTRATAADHAEIAELAETMPVDELIHTVATVAADALGTAILQQGKRPADYWRDVNLSKTLASRIVTALGQSQGEYAAAFQAYLRGRG